MKPKLIVRKCEKCGREIVGFTDKHVNSNFRTHQSGKYCR
jgi:hypothetical protein